MLFDTSSAEAALDALLSLSYRPPDTTPIFLGEYGTTHSRKSELNNAIRNLEQTVVAVSELEKKVTLLQTRLRNHVATIRRSLSVTTSLPTELLCEIFRMVAVGDASSKARIVLSHVSRRWRGIAIAIPELWTVIETGPGLRWTADMMREFGRRAGPLELNVSSSHTYRELPADLDRSFAARCTKVSLLGDVSYSALRALLPPGYHDSTIRELTLEAPRHGGKHAPVFEFGCELLACRTMHLRGVQLSAESLALSLTVLHVENMTIQDLMEVISTPHCADLEELYISNIVVDDSEDEVFVVDCSEAIGECLDELRKLRHLALKECTPKILGLILRHWTKPLPASLDIDPGRITTGGDALAFSVILLRMLRSRAQKLESLALSGPADWMISVGAVLKATVPATFLPSLHHLAMRVYARGEDAVGTPEEDRLYSEWGLDFVSARSSASSELPRLETLAISEWIMKGHEDQFREHVGELILLS